MSIEELIKVGQQHSCNFVGHDIAVDGVKGEETRRNLIRCFQHACNQDYGSGLELDGVFGSKTNNALKGHYVERGETQCLVTAVQIALYCFGYDPKGLENPGVFGQGTEDAVKAFQFDHGLVTDGVAGCNTIGVMIGETISAGVASVSSDLSYVRQRVVELAEEYIGYTEDDKYSIFGDYYGDPCGEWCHYFASYIYEKAGGADLVPQTGYCPTGIEWFKDRGQFGDYPCVGDLVYFDWNFNGTPDHVGIVVSVDGDTFGTVEGNTGSDDLYCQRKEWSVGSQYVLGFGCPDC